MTEQATAIQRLDQAIQVTFRYPVCFTNGLFALHNPLLKEVVCGGQTGGTHKLLCVVDQVVAQQHPSLIADIEAYCRHHDPLLTLVCSPILISGGEHVKNDPVHVTALHRLIHEHRIDRHSYVMVVGGGALIDMVGYTAATAHRGIRLIRVPTTVLAQNDSAVGVKNSVNAFGKKNFLGTFAPPYAVLNDFLFLTSLSDRDWRSGIAEAIKVALLKDASFFDFIEQHVPQLMQRNMAAMQWLIYRCAQLHLHHIATSGDPFEFGSSRPLDFGHWAAHKLEQLSNYALRHGEAVALGIALDSTYAHRLGLLPEHDWLRILDLFIALGFAISTPELSSPALLDGLSEFREHLGGQLTIMLLQQIGSGIEVHEVDCARIVESVALLKTYQAAQTEGGMEWPHIPARVRSHNDS